MKETIIQILVIVGLLMLAAGIIMPIISMDIHSDTFRYIFSAGAVLLLAGRIFTSHDEAPTRLKRLYRIEAWSAVFFCVAAVFMFYDKSNLRDPLAFILAGALIQVYVSLMIPRVAKKSKK